jgi:hypothetical protein
MARHRSPRVKQFWHLLQEMQRLIDEDKLPPNKAAVRLANKHWRAITKGKYESAVDWLKDNQRKFCGELRKLSAVERMEKFTRENPGWREKVWERELRHVEAMAENTRKFFEEHSEELERKLRADRRAAWRAWRARFDEDPEAALAEIFHQQDC